MEANKTIDDLGGTSAVAALCDITTGAVSQWRTNGIPKPWTKFLAGELAKKQRTDLIKTKKEVA